MKIFILLSEENQTKVEASFKQQKCVGISFEFYTDFDEVMAMINARGFFMDKLVIISSMFRDWTDIQRSQITRQLLRICEHLSTDKEIYLLDSSQYFKNDYTTTLNFYPQVIYQPQRIEVKNLFGLITGDIETQDAPNINENVKKPGIFAKLFSREKPAQVQEVPVEQQMQESNSEVGEDAQEEIDTNPFNLGEDADTPLFEETSTEQTQWVQSAEQQEELVDIVEDIIPSASQNEAGYNSVHYDDTPLFEDTPLFDNSNSQAMPEAEDPLHIPEPQPVDMPDPMPMPISEPISPSTPEPAPAPTPVLTPEPKAKKEPKPKQRPEPKPESKPKPKPEPAPKISKKSADYLAVFQKRTKTILITGERRSGVSTAVSNLAVQAQNDGLKVLVIDLDYERRGQMINFPFIHDENDIRMTHSLYNANKNPSQVEEYAIHLADGLDLLGTSLTVTETKLMHEHVSNESLQRLLTISSNAYDLLFIDCPYEQLKEYPCLIWLASTIIHSMNTDQRAVINALNAITTDDFDNADSYNNYMTKVMLLLNNYIPHFWNGRELNERMVPIFMCDLLGDSIFQNVAVVGRIPHYEDYDHYMEDGNMLVNSKKYANDFIGLLNEIAIRG